MKVIIGSKNQDKIDILKQVLEELHLSVEVSGVEVEPGITDQPLDKEITLIGAKNQAIGALKINPDVDFAFGLEGGLNDYGEGYHLVTYACLIDKNGYECIGQGKDIPLPEVVSEKVKTGGWFGDIIREYAKDNPIDDNLITRVTPFTQAIHNAYAGYLKTKGNLGYRQGTIGIVIDDKQNFLIVQLESYRGNDWRLPGGGVDEGETPEQTILRELKEELGTDKFEIIKRSKLTVKYDWPDFVVAKQLQKNGRTYQGQEQVQFLIKFTGKTDDFHPDPVEIKNIKWVKYEELQKHFNFPNQWEEAEKVLADLLP